MLLNIEVNHDDFTPEQVKMIRKEANYFVMLNACNSSILREALLGLHKPNKYGVQM